MSQDLGKRSSRRPISIATIGAGAVLLLLVPIYVLFNSMSGNTNAPLEGTWLIISVVSGMALVAVGAALGD
ncbi:MAG: hypothetical protein M3437_13830 [Chloroflexota bacterium]|nr:hypothetical protein [Chloroflexota bacterium]MDQ5864306.1 hypothetical protein [Chloroflexota bacterium]